MSNTLRRLLAVSSLLASLAGWAGATPAGQHPSQKQTLHIAHQNRGILTVEFDPRKNAQESLQIVATTEAGFQPGWLCSRDNLLYSVSRSQFAGENSTSGGVFVFQQKANHGTSSSLQAFGNWSSYGEGGVFCDISRDGRLLSVANIDGATVSVYPRTEDGRLDGNASAVTFHYSIAAPGPGHDDSQIQANPHQAAFDPSGEFLFVPDRGDDALYVYRVVVAGAGTQPQPYLSTVQLQQTVRLPGGTGPRHVTFRVVDKRRFLIYLVSELDNTLRVFSAERCDPAGTALAIRPLQTESTLGPGGQPSAPDGKNLAAEVTLSTDGRFVYVSNRNTVSYDSDTLAIYAVQRNGALDYIGHNATYGKIPRHFSVSPDAGSQYVAVANEVSNNVIIFERNQKTGFLGRVAGNLTLGPMDIKLESGPMAVLWR